MTEDIQELLVAADATAPRGAVRPFRLAEVQARLLRRRMRRLAIGAAVGAVCLAIAPGRRPAPPQTFVEDGLSARVQSLLAQSRSDRVALELRGERALAAAKVALSRVRAMNESD